MNNNKPGPGRRYVNQAGTPGGQAPASRPAGRPPAGPGRTPYAARPGVRPGPPAAVLANHRRVILLIIIAVVAGVVLTVSLVAYNNGGVRGEPDLMQGEVYMGNTAGNIVNGGRFVQAPDGGVYFVCGDFDYNYGLYYVPDSGFTGFVEKVTDDIEPYLNIVDNELYFSYQREYGKVSLSSPENEPDLLGIDSMECIYIVNGWIYYEESGRLKKCRTDGRDKTTITRIDEICSIGNGWIVYWSDDANIYKIRTNGAEKTKLLDGIAVNYGPPCIISGDWLYYISNLGDNDSIKKIQLNTGEDVTVFDIGMESVQWMNVQDDWIYYHQDNGIYRVGTDGEGQTLIYELSEDEFSPQPQGIAVIGDWIYWLSGGTIVSFDPATSGKTCLAVRVATDGSASESIILDEGE